MSVFNIADIPTEYSCKYNMLNSRSKKYSSDASPLFKIEVDDEYYKQKREIFPNATDEEIEYLGIGSAFYKKLLEYDGVMLHASAVALDGKAYLFSAPSGTGKSTHTALWLKHFGKDRAKIINDDKPAIRKIDGRYYAFGTPFSGKHDISINEGYPIQGICFLVRGEKNFIYPLDTEEALSAFFSQTIRPEDSEKMDLLCNRVDDILKEIPIYCIHCNCQEEAAEVSYKGMK